MRLLSSAVVFVRVQMLRMQYLSSLCLYIGNWILSQDLVQVQMSFSLVTRLWWWRFEFLEVIVFWVLALSRYTTREMNVLVGVRTNI